MGNSHDPDDPHFAQFKADVLKRYGVTRIEDLPVNYKGLLALEGEAMTSRLFDRYAAESFAIQARQNALVTGVGLLSPTIALRQASMAAAGTDFAGHRRCVEHAEAYRYALVRRLNRLQAEAVSYADDTAKDAGAGRRKRIGADNWRRIPEFTFVQPDARTLARASLPGLAIVLGWLAVAGAGLAIATRRLGAK